TKENGVHLYNLAVALLNYHIEKSGIYLNSLYFGRIGQVIYTNEQDRNPLLEPEAKLILSKDNRVGLIDIDKKSVGVHQVWLYDISEKGVPSNARLIIFDEKQIPGIQIYDRWDIYFTVNSVQNGPNGVIVKVTRPYHKYIALHFELRVVKGEVQ